MGKEQPGVILNHVDLAHIVLPLDPERRLVEKVPEICFEQPAEGVRGRVYPVKGIGCHPQLVLAKMPRRLTGQSEAYGMSIRLGFLTEQCFFLFVQLCSTHDTIFRWVVQGPCRFMCCFNKLRISPTYPVRYP